MKLFDSVAKNVTQSVADQGFINLLQSKSVKRRRESLDAIIMKYPYVELQGQHEEVFRDMVLQTQANIQVFKYDKSIHTFLMTYMRLLENPEGLLERNIEAQRYLEGFEITSLEPKDVERLLKEKYDDSTKKARSIFTIVDAWITDIKKALADRKTRWEERRLTADPNCRLTSAVDDATEFPQIDLDTRKSIAHDLREMEPSVEVSEVEEMDRSVYPTLNAKVFDSATTKRLGMTSPFFVLLNSHTHSFSLTVLFVFRFYCRRIFGRCRQSWKNVST